MDIKEKALEYAIKANLQTKKDDDGHLAESVDALIEGAKKIEAYLKDAENGN